MAEGHGAIVFAAGAAGSGRGDLLQELATRLPRTASRPLVVRGSMSGGAFQPTVAPSEPTSTTTPAVTAALGLAAAVYPLAGLLGQLISASRAVADHLGAAPTPSISHLASAFRAAARERPVVCLVDAADESDGRWWSDLLLFGLANEIATVLPVLLVLTVEGGRQPGEHRADEPDALYTARELAADGLAEWIQVPLIDPPDLAGITGDAEPAVLTNLARLSDRRAGWAARLWSEWRATGVVERDTDLAPWRFAAGQPDLSGSLTDLLRDRLLHLLGDDAALRRTAWRHLTYAAVEGRYFTAETIAVATSTDASTVTDLLHRLSPAITHEAGSVVSGTGSGTLTRFRFTSALTRPALLRFGATREERQRATKAMVRALILLYGADAPSIAARLAYLSTQLGEHETADTFRSEANDRMPAQDTLDSARAIAREDPARMSAWDASRCRRAARTLSAGVTLVRAHAGLDEAIALGGLAALLAERAGDYSTQADALSIRGGDELIVGRPDEARAHLEQSRAIWQRLRREDGVAHALRNIAWLDGRTGDRDSARRGTDEALIICRRLALPRLELELHLQMANLASGWNDYELARQALGAAEQLAHHATPLDRGRLLEIRGSLAIDSQRYDEAVEALQQAVSWYEAVDDERLAASARRGVAIAIGHLDSEAGRALLAQELAVAESMDNLLAVLNVHEALAHLDIRVGRVEEGRRGLSRCIELCEELGWHGVMARLRDELAGLATSQNGEGPAKAGPSET